MWITSWIAMAHAGELPQIEATVGLEGTFNDPFVRRRGPVGSVAARWNGWTSTALSGAWYPNLGQADYTGATQILIERNGLVPDISRVQWRAVALQDFVVFHGDPSAQFTGGLRLGLGGGVLGTADDLELLGKGGEAQAERTASEVHPVFAASVAMDLSKGDYGLRARVTQTRYTERFDGTEERKTPLWAGLELLVTPGRAAP
ncbi:MAG: hypothetical protein ABMA64_41130 [Myxococcota bacterium]